MMKWTVLILAVALYESDASASDSGCEVMEWKEDDVVQEQIKRYVRSASGKEGRGKARELRANLSKVNDEELTRQVALYAISPGDDPGVRVLRALYLLDELETSPNATIRVLAPCLGAESKRLRELACEWFQSREECECDRHIKTYGRYVCDLELAGRQVPADFVRRLFASSPERGLRTFSRAMKLKQARIRLAEMAAEQRDAAEGGKVSGDARQMQDHGLDNREEAHHAAHQVNREVEAARHIIEGAIWLKAKRHERLYNKAIPEVRAQIAVLAAMEQWWARRYAVEILRRHAELRQPGIVESLLRDENPLVSDVAEKLSL